MNRHAFTRTVARRLPSRRAVLALATAFALLPAARAQSVQVGGDVGPFPSSNPQATWDLGAAELSVGQTGSGSLAITDGGSVIGDGSDDIRDFRKISTLGRDAGAHGEATVTGAGSLWSLSHSHYVGRNGTGLLTIANGGSVSSGIDGVLGDGGGSRGTATVTGAGSSWTAGYNLYVGIEGTGSLTIADGATVTNGTYEPDAEANLGDGYIGALGSGRGTVTVTGAGSSWTSRANLVLGGFDIGIPSNEASGTLTIEKGGVVNVGETLKNHSTGTVAISVSHSAPALTVGGDLDNDGVVRISAAPSLAAGTYTPLAVAGALTGVGQYQALGGTWDSGTRLFTVTEAATAVSGAETTFDLSETQRVTVGGDQGTVTASFGADDQAVGGGSNISFSATENNVDQIGGQTVLAAWDFHSTLDYTRDGMLIELSMSFRRDLDLIDWDHNRLSLMHSLDGLSWFHEPRSLRLLWADGVIVGVNTHVRGFSSYAVTLVPIPEPASFAALAGLGALGLVASRRRRRAA